MINYAYVTDRAEAWYIVKEKGKRKKEKGKRKKEKGKRKKEKGKRKKLED
jgi:hypothetical protein